MPLLDETKSKIFKKACFCRAFEEKAYELAQNLLSSLLSVCWARVCICNFGKLSGSQCDKRLPNFHSAQGAFDLPFLRRESRRLGSGVARS